MIYLTYSHDVFLDMAACPYQLIRMIIWKMF